MLELLAAFLLGRTMTVRVGKQWSARKPVNAGSPQGSVLGGFLFNVGIDHLEDGCQFPDMPFFDQHVETSASTADYPAASTPARISSFVEELAPSPIHTAGPDFVLEPRVANVPPWIRAPKERTWKDSTPVVKKYIDDNINLDVVNMLPVQAVVEKGALVREIHPVRSQALLEHIVDRSAAQGMVVNDNKTTLMCVSAATSYKARAVLKDRNNNTIRSEDTMKILGCNIDATCGMGTQAENVRKKLRSRTWGLPVLKKAGFTNEELVRVYKSQIRPVAEYSSAAWHSLLTQEQSLMIERQQNQALKHIYGYKTSAAKMRKMFGIDTLEKRRVDACLKFGLKCAGSERFKHWFVKAAGTKRDRRSTGLYKEYVEPQARTDRHNDSPLNYCRRLVNKHLAAQ